MIDDVHEQRPRTVGGDGVRLHVRGWTGDGPDVLLLHGLASSSHIWDLVAPRLTRLGIRVVAFDQRGHGLSGKPSAGYGFDRTSDDVVAVIRAMRLRRPVVVGHSWGANVALEVAVRRPRLIGGAVLLDGAFLPLRERFAWPAAKQHLSPPQLNGMTVDAFLARIHDRWGRWLEPTPETDAVFLSLIRVDRAGRIRPRLTRANHLRILRAMWEQDSERLLRRVRVPTLVLAARAPGTPDADGLVRARRAGSERIRTIGSPVSFEWIHGIHDVPLQRPEAVARRIARFAAGVTAAAPPHRSSRSS